MLASGGRSAPIYVSGKDFPGVVRAANDLRADVERVTGTAPRVVADSAPSGQQVVIVGTLGKSPIIDRLVREKKIDGAAIAGKWEAFVVQPVEKPMPGVDRALVIAGSDKRGTIYGVYDLSERDRRVALVLVGRRADGAPVGAVRHRRARTRRASRP